MEQIKEKALHEAATSEQGTNEIDHKDNSIPGLIMQVLEPTIELMGILGRDSDRHFHVVIDPAMLRVCEYNFTRDKDDIQIASRKDWVDADLRGWREPEWIIRSLKNSVTTMQDLLGSIRKEIEDGKE